MRFSKTVWKLAAAMGILVFLAASIPMPQRVEAQGWHLSGWQYRKRHVLTGAANAGVGYQMMFRVLRTSGTDVNNTVYLSGKCRSDFGDVRFTDISGNVFPYAVTFRTADEAWFWVRPTFDLTVNQIIYIYYGNPTATSASNYDATFIFAEPWENATLNPQRWTIETGISGSFTVEPTLNRLRTYYSGSSGNIKLRSTRTDILFPTAYRVESWIAPQYATDINLIGFRYATTWATPPSTGYVRSDWSIHTGPWTLGDGGAVFATHYATGASTPNFRRFFGVGHVDEPHIAATNPVDFVYLFTRTPTNFINIQVGTVNNFTKQNFEQPNRIYFATQVSGSSSYTATCYIYAFKIRKYVNPEPGHGAWFPEESFATLKSSLTVNAEPSWLPRVRFNLGDETFQVPFSGNITPGTYTLHALNDQVVCNASHIYNFKGWRKDGYMYSYNRQCTFTVGLGENADFKIVYETCQINVSTSPPGLTATFEADGWTLATPATIYRGPGYHTFAAKTDVVYFNSTHLLRFYGWFVNNLYMSPDKTLNLYVVSDMTVKLAYSFQEIPPPPPMIFRAQIISLGQLSSGTTRDFTVTVLFDQNAITITDVAFQLKTEWFKILDPLPMYASRGLESMGAAAVQAQLKVPQNIEGFYSIPFTVTANTLQGETVTTASYVTFTVVSQPQVTETTTLIQAGFMELMQRLLGDPLILALLLLMIIVFASYSVRNRRR